MRCQDCFAPLLRARNNRKFVLEIMNVLKERDIDFNGITDILRSSGVIVYPTDTAYALGCDATNEIAVAKIFQIKAREADKTLPVIVASAAMAEEWADFSEEAKRLAEEYWPGPLTLVLPMKKSGLVRAVVGEGNFIALRVPNNDMARQLSAELGKPIISTSANKAGAGPFYNMEAVKQSLAESLFLINDFIDAGELPVADVSTMVKVCDNKVTVIRQGVIKI